MAKAVERDLRRMFGLDIAVGVVGLVAMIVVVLVGLSAIHIGAQAASKELVVAGHRLTYPEVNLAAAVVLLFAGLGVAVLTRAMRELFRQVHRQRIFLGALDVHGPLRGHPDVTVVEDDQPQAFCAGYRRPRIHISTGALRVLAQDELDAVLAHERHHCSRHDPLRLALIAVLSRSLFVLPVVRRLSDRYGAFVEVTADEAAVTASSGSPAPLASAMLVFLGGENGNPAVVGIAPERVDHLLGRGARWQPPVALLIGGVLSIAAIVVVALTAGQAASARTSLNLPLLSSQPCIMLLALIPLLAGTTAVLTLRRVWR